MCVTQMCVDTGKLESLHPLLSLLTPATALTYSVQVVQWYKDQQIPLV